MAKLYIPPLHPLIDAITLPVEGELPQTTLRKVIEERVKNGSARHLLEAIFDVCFSGSKGLVKDKKTILTLWLKDKTNNLLQVHCHTAENESQYVLTVGRCTGVSCLGSPSNKNKQWAEAFLRLVEKIGNE